MGIQNPTIGYFKYKGICGSKVRQSKLNQACRFVSNNFSVVSEFNYEYGIEIPHRFVWHNIIRLIKKGQIKTLVLSELNDCIDEPIEFANFILLLQVRQIRLICIREGFDSRKQGHFYALQLQKPNKKERKINGFAA